ncbi:hypothetical protein RJT34_05972 [Clitoria ternatea]|uniref:Uncharacterized protein n=1 Tax=Clitoria ternatea TaxID=43366 RepID=A0AAN9PTE8_CLITE
MMVKFHVLAPPSSILLDFVDVALLNSFYKRTFPMNDLVKLDIDGMISVADGGACGTLSNEPRGELLGENREAFGLCLLATVQMKVEKKGPDPTVAGLQQQVSGRQLDSTSVSDTTVQIASSKTECHPTAGKQASVGNGEKLVNMMHFLETELLIGDPNVELVEEWKVRP